MTGHSYVVYGPLLHGATQVMYEGAPDFPDASRIWEIIQKYKVSIFYTTPTALRMHMKFGNDFPNSFNLSSLRLLGTVGEPINPEVWKWYFDIIGKNKCPIIDTWWQTETGGMMISNLPGIETIPLKPGSATRPIPGVDIMVVDDDGNEVDDGVKGSLVIRKPWPGMLLTLWNDNEKYSNVYWSKYEGMYYPGDYAIKDSDGYLWLLGRSDDVLKDDVSTSNDELCKELTKTVRNEIGAIATPSQFYFVSRLPKTRSGKIMRRLLKAIANKEKIGDVSTLEDGAAVDEVKSTFNELQNAINKDN